MALDHNELTAVAAVVSALVALVSATVGPFVSWKIAKRQIVTTVRATSRQQWIDNLRDEVAEFIGFLIEGGIKRTGNTIAESDVNELARIQSQKLARIALLLNPAEEKHNQLMWFLREAHSETWNPAIQPDAEKVREKTDRALDICKEILKLEWDRTKEGE
jgi:hypothetical protein